MDRFPERRLDITPDEISAHIGPALAELTYGGRVPTSVFRHEAAAAVSRLIGTDIVLEGERPADDGFPIRVEQVVTAMMHSVLVARASNR